jgi:hypothetical protein
MAPCLAGCCYCTAAAASEELPVLLLLIELISLALTLTEQFINSKTLDGTACRQSSRAHDAGEARASERTKNIRSGRVPTKFMRQCRVLSRKPWQSRCRSHMGSASSSASLNRQSQPRNVYRLSYASFVRISHPQSTFLVHCCHQGIQSRIL